MWFLIKDVLTVSPSLHPQCLWQEAHPRVQAINSPLHARLPLRPQQHSRNTPPEWADPSSSSSSSPPCSQPDPGAAPGARTAAANGERRLSQPAASAPGPQPQPAVRRAVCPHQPGWTQLHTWAQVSTLGPLYLGLGLLTFIWSIFFISFM